MLCVYGAVGALVGAILTGFGWLAIPASIGFGSLTVLGVGVIRAARSYH